MREREWRLDPVSLTSDTFCNLSCEGPRDHSLLKLEVLDLSNLIQFGF